MTDRIEFNIFGDNYSTIATSIFNFDELISQIPQILFSIQGHIIGLFLIYSPLLFLILYSLLNYPNRTKVTGVSLFTLIAVFFIICMISWFTVQAIDMGPYERYDRLSLRHYNYILPLLIIIGTYLAFQDYNNLYFNKKLFNIIFVLFLIINTYAIFNLKLYFPTLGDSPELITYTFSNFWYYLFSLSILFCLIYTYFKKKNGVLIYLFLWLPSFILYSNYIHIVINTRKF
jgi:hypothetical protein